MFCNYHTWCERESEVLDRYAKCKQLHTWPGVITAATFQHNS